MPDAKLVREMVGEVSQNLDGLSKFASAATLVRMREDLEAFSVDPSELARRLDSPSLVGENCGTHFYILRVEESLVAALDAPAGDDETASPLYKMLVGFTNTMTPRHPKPVIETKFRDHKTEEIAEDIIAVSEFFTPYEFENADHHVEGTFDEFGQFRGTVTVFGEPTEDYVVPWPARAQPTDCGRFLINLAVVQGVASQSTVPTDDWVRIIRKMNRIGGLYIYRDGIRILPYGNNDYDFLDIEKNRTKSAGYYYFSYRRIFGVVAIDRRHNAALQEKAGREGFLENRAYRQFREILKNFFVQVAADFFREGSAKLGRYEERRAELSRLEKVKRIRERQVSVRRNEFRDRLAASSKDIADGRAAQQVSEVLSNLDRDIKVAEAEQNPSRSATAFIEAEAQARKKLAGLREQYRLTPPRGIGLSQTVRRDYEAYRTEYDHLLLSVLEPTQLRIQEMLERAAAKTKVAIDRRLRFERALTDLAAAARKNTQTGSQGAREAADDVRERVGELARVSIRDVERAVSDVLSRAARLDVSKLDDQAFVSQRTALESQVERTSDEEFRKLSAIAEQLRAISSHLQNSQNGDAAPAEITEALEEEVIALRERSEADLELAQLGMAIQVVNHEFDATIRAVRKNIRELRAWADTNESIRKLYESIRDNFSHLDGYLALFTPLQRRLYRSVVRITGADIFKFLEDLFEERLKRHSVTLQATTAFKRHALMGYPSTFYPVFVNLVDNAIYWVARRQGTRIIRLDASGDILTVSDSGSGIGERDRDVIFDLGFTRKPGGRGLGLHISRDVLARANYRLSLAADSSDLGGAEFQISPTPNEEAKAVRPTEEQ